MARDPLSGGPAAPIPVRRVSAARRLARGLAAGAVGTAVLDVATYLDMAVTGRPASSAPLETVTAAADAAGASLPGDDDAQQALAALSGIGVGIGVGVVAATVRGAGLRLPLLAEAAVIGVGAMAATDGPMAVLGATDVAGWSAADWARDLAPHLAYGAAVAATLRALEDPAEVVEPDAPRPAPLLLRSLAIGLASGARSTLGLLPAGAAVGTAGTAVTTALVGTELVLDKAPFTPSRVAAGPTVARVVTGASGAAVLARDAGVTGVLPAAAAGAVGAVAGTLLGAAWRQLCSERDWTWQGALGEDAAALALTAYAVRGRTTA